MSTPLFLPTDSFSRESFNDKITNINDDISTLNETMADTINTKLSDIPTMKTNISNNTNNITTAKSDITNVKSRLSTVESKATAHDEYNNRITTNTNNLSNLTTNFNNHNARKNNPHGVTAEQVGAIGITNYVITNITGQYCTVQNYSDTSCYTIGKLCAINATFSFRVFQNTMNNVVIILTIPNLTFNFDDTYRRRFPILLYNQNYGEQDFMASLVSTSNNQISISISSLVVDNDPSRRLKLIANEQYGTSLSIVFPKK